MNLNNLICPPTSEEPTNNSKNVLTHDVAIEGILRFDGEMIFGGKLKGEIVSTGELILGKSAVVDAEIKVKSTTIYGTVNGNVTVTEKCELKSSAQLVGNLKAARIVIEEGASFVGQSEVSTAGKSSKIAENPRSLHSTPPAAQDTNRTKMSNSNG